MRRLAAIVFSLLFASTAFAQQKNSLSVFYSNPSFWWTSGYGGHSEGGVGLAVSHAFSPSFSTELSVARERYTLLRSVSGAPPYRLTTVHVMPIDAMAKYHFLTESRWKPYAGLGLRYASTNEVGRGQYTIFRTPSFNPEVSGGVVFQLRPRIGLVVDAKQLIGTHDLHSDPAFKVSAGFHWRF